MTSLVPTNPSLLMTLSPSLLPVPPSLLPLSVALYSFVSICLSLHVVPAPLALLCHNYRCPFPRRHMFFFMPMQACWSP